VGRTCVIRKLCLQFAHFRPHDVLAVIEHHLHAAVDLSFKEFVLRFEINEIHVVRSWGVERVRMAIGRGCQGRDPIVAKEKMGGQALSWSQRFTGLEVERCTTRACVTVAAGF